MTDKPRRLGRGLEALIGTSIQPTPTASPAIGEATALANSPFQDIEIQRIRPNPFQPRKEFKEEDLVQLQASLAESGLLQPITVRAAGDHFELVAGERRFRAATRLGWKAIPAIVKDFDDKALLDLRNALQETDDVRRLSRRMGNGLGAVAGLDDVEARDGQLLCVQAPQIRLIFY